MRSRVASRGEQAAEGPGLGLAVGIVPGALDCLLRRIHILPTIMPGPPRTQYAKSGRVHIAYQVLGEGPLDLVLVHGWVSHLELWWDHPAAARALRRLASFSRLILFDKRGTGLSDPVPVDQLPTLEQRMEDVRAVMDAAGSERAALMGTSEGGPMNLLFAATYPKRTAALILYASCARLSAASDYPWGTPPDVRDKLLDRIDKEWGTGVMLSVIAASHTNDPQMREWWARYQRQAASPGASVALLRMAYDIDVRAVLNMIRTPTLILHRTQDRMMPVGHSRYMAEHIHGAKFVELPGQDHLFFVGDADAMLDEIREFLTGTREPGEPERILATVLFADIVASTERGLATIAGTSCSTVTTSWLADSSRVFVGARSTRRATASLQRSMARPGPFAALRRSRRASARSASKYVPGAIPANARSLGRSSGESPFTSARAWLLWRVRARCSSPIP